MNSVDEVPQASEEHEFEMPKPGNQPVILEIVEYIVYLVQSKYSKERIFSTLSKVYTAQEIEVAFAFYEKFFRR